MKYWGELCCLPGGLDNASNLRKPGGQATATRSEAVQAPSYKLGDAMGLSYIRAVDTSSLDTLCKRYMSRCLVELKDCSEHRIFPAVRHPRRCRSLPLQATVKSESHQLELLS